LRNYLEGLELKLTVACTEFKPVLIPEPLHVQMAKSRNTAIEELNAFLKKQGALLVQCTIEEKVKLWNNLGDYQLLHFMPAPFHTLRTVSSRIHSY